FARGSKEGMDYYKEGGLLPYLEARNFHCGGFGFTTCMGYSGPLPDPVSKAVAKENLPAPAGPRGSGSLEGRITTTVKANYRRSASLVVANALAGTVDIEPGSDPIGKDSWGKPVSLREIWPTNEEVQSAVQRSINQGMFQHEYAHAFEGDENWKTMPV